MKSQVKNRINKKIVFIVAMVSALVILLFGWYIFIYRGSIFGWSPINQEQSNNSSDPSSKINYNKPSPEEINGGTAVKNGKTDNQAVNPPKQVNGKDLISVTVTSPSQNVLVANNDVYQIRVVVSTITGNGTCTLTLTKGTTTITKTSAVQTLPSSSTCKGFDIPISEPGLTAGSWQLTIRFDNDSSTGIVTKVVRID